jgi:hypothetical protein
VRWQLITQRLEEVFQTTRLDTPAGHVLLPVNAFDLDEALIRGLDTEEERKVAEEQTRLDPPPAGPRVAHAQPDATEVGVSP